MFQIKICGIRLPHEVTEVAQAGADAIGLNFYEPSIRYVDPDAESTRELSHLAAEHRLLRVGVFVNRSAESIGQIVRDLELDAIQLHGDESIDQLPRIQAETDAPVLRAIKLPTCPLSPAQISDRCSDWIDAGCQVLLDADGGSLHGGSGQSLHWPSIATWAEESPTVRWILAGGLNPENVAEAIQLSRAPSVDTASGVEQPRGTKSRDRIVAFVQNVQLARLKPGF